MLTLCKIHINFMILMLNRCILCLGLLCSKFVGYHSKWLKNKLQFWFHVYISLKPFAISYRPTDQKYFTLPVTLSLRRYGRLLELILNKPSVAYFSKLPIGRPIEFICRI